MRPRTDGPRHHDEVICDPTWSVQRIAGQLWIGCHPRGAKFAGRELADKIRVVRILSRHHEARPAQLADRDSNGHVQDLAKDCCPSKPRRWGQALKL